MEKAVVQMLVKIKKNVLVKQGTLKQSNEIFSKAKPSTKMVQLKMESWNNKRVLIYSTPF